MTKFYPPSSDRAFLTKKTLQDSLKARNLKKSSYIAKMMVMPDLNCIFFIRKNIVHQFGYFREKPPPHLPLCLVSFFSWKWQTFLLNVFHNWNNSQGTSDKVYPPNSDRAYLTKNLFKILMARNLKKSRYIAKLVVTSDLNSIFFIRKNIVHQFGYFRKKPPPPSACA